MGKQCCFCRKVGDTLLTRFLKIRFACPHNSSGGEAFVHQGDCWTKLWQAYLAELRAQRQAAA